MSQSSLNDSHSASSKIKGTIGEAGFNAFAAERVNAFSAANLSDAEQALLALQTDRTLHDSLRVSIYGSTYAASNNPPEMYARLMQIINESQIPPKLERIGSTILEGCQMPNYFVLRRIGQFATPVFMRSIFGSLTEQEHVAVSDSNLAFYTRALLFPVFYALSDLVMLTNQDSPSDKIGWIAAEWMRSLDIELPLKNRADLIRYLQLVYSDGRDGLLNSYLNLGAFHSELNSRTPKRKDCPAYGLTRLIFKRLGRSFSSEELLSQI